MGLQKVQMNLDESLIKQVDVYAESLHITRTAAVSVLLSNALNAQNAMDTLNELMSIYRAEQAKAKGIGSGQTVE